MDGLLASIRPEAFDAIQGLGHMVGRSSTPPNHLSPQGPPKEATQEVEPMKRSRKPSKIPKPIRYVAGAIVILVFLTVGLGRSEGAREEILDWMRG